MECPTVLKSFVRCYLSGMQATIQGRTDERKITVPTMNRVLFNIWNSWAWDMKADGWPFEELWCKFLKSMVTGHYSDEQQASWLILLPPLLHVFEIYTCTHSLHITKDFHCWCTASMRRLKADAWAAKTGFKQLIWNDKWKMYMLLKTSERIHDTYFQIKKSSFHLKTPSKQKTNKKKKPTNISMFQTQFKYYLRDCSMFYRKHFKVHKVCKYISNSVLY